MAIQSNSNQREEEMGTDIKHSPSRNGLSEDSVKAIGIKEDSFPSDFFCICLKEGTICPRLQCTASRQVLHKLCIRVRSLSCFVLFLQGVSARTGV